MPTSSTFDLVDARSYPCVGLLMCPPADQFAAESKQHAVDDRETSTRKRYTREAVTGEGAPIGEPCALADASVCAGGCAGWGSLRYAARCSATPRVAAKCLAATGVVAACWATAS